MTIQQPLSTWWTIETTDGLTDRQSDSTTTNDKRQRQPTTRAEQRTPWNRPATTWFNQLTDNKTEVHMTDISAFGCLRGRNTPLARGGTGVRPTHDNYLFTTGDPHGPRPRPGDKSRGRHDR